MALGGGGGGDGGAAEQERKRQEKIDQGMKDIHRQFAGFDDAFYKQAGDRYTAVARPKMFEDYTQARNNLTYSLARGGMLKSSVANRDNASLSNKLAESNSAIANNAADASNRLRADVSSQKGTLVNQLNASANPQAIAEQAVGATASLRAPSVIQPLGDLFADWSSRYLQNQSGNSGMRDNVWQNLQNSNVGNANPSGGQSYFVP